MFYYGGERGRSPPLQTGVMALQHLKLDGTAVGGNVLGLAGAHGLEVLYLFGLPGVHGDLADLAGLTALHHRLIIMYHSGDASYLICNKNQDWADRPFRHCPP